MPSSASRLPKWAAWAAAWVVGWAAAWAAASKTLAAGVAADEAGADAAGVAADEAGAGGGGGGGGGGVGGGGGGGGGGGARGGGGRGGFSIPPEKTVRVDVPLLCMDHGLREPSSSKPYAIVPIENVIKDPAVIEVIAAYANGDLPTGAAQAAIWNMNSEVSFQELSQKQTGTARSIVREPYFSRDEIQTAMAIVSEARELTAGQEVVPRDYPMPGEEKAKEVVEEAVTSPGEEVPASEQEKAAEEAPAQKEAVEAKDA
jgi:hypothetical protein